MFLRVNLFHLKVFLTYLYLEILFILEKIYFIILNLHYVFVLVLVVILIFFSISNTSLIIIKEKILFNLNSVHNYLYFQCVLIKVKKLVFFIVQLDFVNFYFCLINISCLDSLIKEFLLWKALMIVIPINLYVPITHQNYQNHLILKEIE